jgi:hypothetical protein
LGTGTITTLIFIAAILAAVVHLTVGKRDRTPAQPVATETATG